MDILLINPRSYRRNLLGARQLAYMPLASITLATYLKKKGLDPKIIDMAVENDHEKKIKKIINKKKPTLIGISLLGYNQLPFALRISEIVKAENPNTKIVWGGPFTDTIGNRALEDPRVDIVVNGEGEETLHQLARAIEKNTNLRKVDGITYKKGNKIIRNKDRKFLDMNKLPFVDYSFLKRNIKRYEPSIMLETSRGCPHRCRYCGTPIHNKFKWRQKSASRAVDELEYIKNTLDYEEEIDYYICDPNPWLTDKRLFNFCEEVINRRLNVKLWSFEHVDLIKRKRLKIMEKAGFHRLTIGVESGSEEILKMIQRDTKISEIIPKIKMFNDYSIRPEWAFMMGLPNEKISHVYKTLDLIDEIKKICPKSKIIISLFKPFPKMSLYYLLKDEGVKLPETVDDFLNFDYTERINPEILRIYYFTYLLFGNPTPYNIYYKMKSKILDMINIYISHKYKKRRFGSTPETRILGLMLKPVTGAKI